VRERTDVLDSAGSTTAAIGKGFAIGAAILTSLALFAAFLTRADLLLKEQDPTSDLPGSINLLDPMVFSGLFIGAVLPALFTAMTMKSVGSAAFKMIEEVRRQFRDFPGIMEGTGDPDYAQCVAISTKAAVREMVAPGILIMGAPLVTGFLFGIQATAGLLAGSLVAGGGRLFASGPRRPAADRHAGLPRRSRIVASQEFLGPRVAAAGCRVTAAAELADLPVACLATVLAREPLALDESRRAVHRVVRRAETGAERRSLSRRLFPRRSTAGDQCDDRQFDYGFFHLRIPQS